MNFIWCKTFFYKECFKCTILNCIHFKWHRQHSWFRQLYKTLLDRRTCNFTRMLMTGLLT
jgi:hypothetical protein